MMTNNVPTYYIRTTPWLFSFVQIRGYINKYDFTNIFIRIWLENAIVLKSV